jgi:hypothetical protein
MVDVLAMPLKLIEFLLDNSYSFGRCPQRGGVVPIIIVGTGEYAIPTLCWYWLLPGRLLRIFCQFLSPRDLNGGGISELLIGLIH